MTKVQTRGAFKKEEAYSVTYNMTRLTIGGYYFAVQGHKHHEAGGGGGGAEKK